MPMSLPKKARLSRKKVKHQMVRVTCNSQAFLFQGKCHHCGCSLCRPHGYFFIDSSSLYTTQILSATVQFKRFVFQNVFALVTCLKHSLHTSCLLWYGLYPYCLLGYTDKYQVNQQLAHIPKHHQLVKFWLGLFVSLISGWNPTVDHLMITYQSRDQDPSTKEQLGL